MWNKAFHAFLTSLGFKRSEADYSLYIRKDVIIIVYVDDLQIFAKSIEVIRNIKQTLMAKYQMTDLGETKRFLGVEINRDRAKKIIRISQERYMDEVLHRFGMQDCKPMKTPSSETRSRTIHRSRSRNRRSTPLPEHARKHNVCHALDKT